jgi:hypothetical protein
VGWWQKLAVGAAAAGVTAVTLAACGSSPGPASPPPSAAWKVFRHLPGVVVITLVRSGLPAGGDIGVESAGFVPPGAAAAYLADRYSAPNKHPGDNAILRLPAAELVRAGIRAGDLLVATEGGARTIDVRCAAACTVRYVAAGPAIAHAEGHIAFASS